MLKNLSEREKKIIILAVAFLVTAPLLFLQVYFVKTKISKLDFSNSPISKFTEEIDEGSSKITEELKIFEEAFKEKEKELEEELIKLEEESKNEEQ